MKNAFLQIIENYIKENLYFSFEKTYVRILVTDLSGQKLPLLLMI